MLTRKKALAFCHRPDFAKTAAGGAIGAAGWEGPGKMITGSGLGLAAASLG